MGFKTTAKRVLGLAIPKRHRRAVRAWLQWHFVGPFYAGNRFHCVCCGGNFKRLLRYWNRLGFETENERCPRCWSLARHRLLRLYLDTETDFGSKPIRLLHFAPEPVMMGYLRKGAGAGYTTADLFEPFVDHHWDLTNIDCPDDQFDAVVCYHVLEHVSDDVKAMSEIFRIMVPGGWAILQPPVFHMHEETIEDPTVTDPQEQARRFGWEGHLRRYGTDIRDRFASVGFEVTERELAKEMPAEEAERLAIDPTETLYVLRKPEA